MSLGDRLLEVRKQTTLNQLAFAKLFNLSDRGYKNYELGYRDPPASLLTKIALKYDINLNWLLLGHGEKSSSHNDEILEQCENVSETLFAEHSSKITIEQKQQIQRIIYEHFLKYGIANSDLNIVLIKEIVGCILEK